MNIYFNICARQVPRHDFLGTFCLIFNLVRFAEGNINSDSVFTDRYYMLVTSMFNALQDCSLVRFLFSMQADRNIVNLLFYKMS